LVENDDDSNVELWSGMHMFTERFILVFAGMTDFEGGDLGQRPTSSASQLSSVQSGSTRFLVFGGKKSRHIFWNHHQEMKTSITQLVVPYHTYHPYY
jgi:hypothetical protein